MFAWRAPRTNYYDYEELWTLSCSRRLATTRVVFGSYPPLGFRFLRELALSFLSKRRMHGAIRYTRARSCSLWAHAPAMVSIH